MASSLSYEIFGDFPDEDEPNDEEMASSLSYEIFGDFPDEDEPDEEENATLTTTGVHQYAFRNVLVDFPYEAYESQIQMMEKIIEGVSDGENCLLESPTGTGKTAALLCALLAWQKRIKPVKPKPSPCSSPEKSKQGMCSCKFDIYPGATMRYIEGDGETEDQVLRDELYAETTPSDSNYFSSKPVTPEKRRRVLTAEAEARTKDQLCPPCVQKYVQFRQQPKLNTSEPDRLPTIYYATRTHSQIKQVIAQLKETAYANVNMTLLSGRNQTCCNSDVLLKDAVDDECAVLVRNFLRKKKAASSNGLEPEDDYDDSFAQDEDQHKAKESASDEIPVVSQPEPGDDRDISFDQDERQQKPKESTATELGLKTCLFYQDKDIRKSEYKRFQRENKMKAWDIEDIVKFGKASGSCPYFGAKELHEDADIVFCSYNYLLYPSIRKASNIKLENSVIVFDEAHNIEQICRDVASIPINETRMREGVLNEVEKLMQKIGLNPNACPTEGLVKLLESLSIILYRLSTWIRNNAQEIEMKDSQVEAVQVFSPKALFENFEKLGLGQARVSALKIDVKILGQRDTFPKLERKAREFIERLVYVLSVIYRDEQKNAPDFSYVLIRQRPKSSSGNPNPKDEKYEFRLICLNPGIAFRKLKHESRSIIVASGTLSPTNSFESELETRFKHQLSASHVVGRSQVWAGILTNPVSGNLKNIELTAVKQANAEVQDWLGQAVLHYCRTVPFGVLVFVPSYKFLNALKWRWRNYPVDNPVLKELQGAKEVFYEESGCSALNFKRQMDTFKDRVITSQNGCLLFAIFRGKVSEGVDFKDEQARAVITIGIPNLPYADPTIASKMDYNEKKSLQPNSNYLSGKQWYDCQAYRAINQAFGRCIRHKHDWGALILLDSRLAKNSDKLSKWVQDFLTTYNNPAPFNQSLILFIKARTEEQITALANM